MSIVLLAPDVDRARQLPALLTVEGEYGDYVWTGRAYTAAHHQRTGPYVGRHLHDGGRPAPCNDPNIPLLPFGVIGVSHLDLDTYGGLFRADPVRRETHFCPDLDAFWALAERVDVIGPHRLETLSPDAGLRRQIRAFWAWNQTQLRLAPDRVVDVTEKVNMAGVVLLSIFTEDPLLMAAADDLWEGEQNLNRASFVHAELGVALRHSDGPFVNALYTTPGGDLLDGVVAWNRGTGEVTVSVADPGVDCRALVRTLWGPNAGGHLQIAGSPRGLRLGFHEADRAVAALRRELHTLRSVG